MLTFSKGYFVLTILLFALEVFIALFVHDNFIRPYVGDALVVILLYCFIKSFLRIPMWTGVILVLVFSFTIEFLQLINIVEKLGLQKSKVASTVIGTSFSWLDLVAYMVGILIILIVEKGLFEKRDIIIPDVD